IYLLPSLATALGASAATGLVAAGLYAAFPPAIAYGSIANLDPLLAPLIVSLLAGVLSPPPRRRGWVRAGIITGVLAGAKPTGLIALVLVPLLSALRPPSRFRGLVVWAVATAVTITLFTNPVAYLNGLRATSERSVETETRPLANLVANVRYATRPDGYYWL